MKGSTVIVGVIGLIVGLVIGIFALSPESETTVSLEGVKMRNALVYRP